MNTQTETPTPMIFDAHLDLSMNALEWNRDLSWSIAEIRTWEKDLKDKPDRGKGTVNFASLRKGNIGIVIGTQIARYTKKAINYLARVGILLRKHGRKHKVN